MNNDKLFEEAENFLNNINDNSKTSIKKVEKPVPKNNNNIISNNGNSNDILLSYINRLKSFGFPELGQITLTLIHQNKKKLFNFLNI